VDIPRTRLELHLLRVPARGEVPLVGGVRVQRASVEAAWGSAAGLKAGTRPSLDRDPTAPREVAPATKSPLRRPSHSAHSMSEGRSTPVIRMLPASLAGSISRLSAISSKRSAGGGPGSPKRSTGHRCRHPRVSTPQRCVSPRALA
jgi:hypothetical protein